MTMDPALLPALFDVLTVVRLGSVGLAARELHKSPSAVSQQIRKVEEAFDIEVFERVGRNLQLRRGAREAVEALQRGFDEMVGAYRALDRLGGAQAQPLRISASDYVSKALLVPAVCELAERTGAAGFEITTAHSAKSVRLMQERRVDVALVSWRDRVPGLADSVLVEQRFSWVTARGNGRLTDLAALLRRQPLVRLAQGSVGRGLLETSLRERGLAPVTTVDVTSVDLLLAYVRGGVGVGLVPSMTLRGGARKGLHVRAADTPGVPIRVLHAGGSKPAPALEALLDGLRRHARGL